MKLINKYINNVDICKYASVLLKKVARENGIIKINTNYNLFLFIYRTRKNSSSE